MQETPFILFCSAQLLQVPFDMDLQLLFQLSGFRRGILNVAMRPAVLRSAVASGGSTRRIKLDHSVGMDEVCFQNRAFKLNFCMGSKK